MEFVSGVALGALLTGILAVVWARFVRSNTSAVARPTGVAELKRFPDPIALTEGKTIVATNLAFTRDFPELAEKKTWKGWIACVDENSRLEAKDAPPYQVQAGRTRADSIFRATDNRLLHWTAVPYPGLGRKLTLNVIRDITAFTDDPLEHSRFLNKAAHELKTPVTSIKGYSELLDMYLQNDRPIPKDFGTRIIVQTNRLVHLVNQLLDVGRLGTGRLTDEPQAVDAGSLTEQSVSRIQEGFPNRAVRMHIEDAPQIFADPKRYENLVRELVLNALQYSAPETTVDVFLRQDHDDLVLTVEDRGIGIPPEETDKVFDRFYRASNVTQSPGAGGFGLGLYLAHSVVERWGGSIRHESDDGVTRAILRFPIRRPPVSHLHDRDRDGAEDRPEARS